MKEEVEEWRRKEEGRGRIGIGVGRSGWFAVTPPQRSVQVDSSTRPIDIDIYLKKELLA